MARKRKTPDGLILVRSTMNQAGLRAGQMAWVDPNESFIAEALEHRRLVEERPLPDEKPPDEIPEE
jgi:hypothetical protein